MAFVQEVLLGFLWSKQKEICESVRANRRTAVPSCHDVGKSAIAGRIAAWWLASHEPGEAFVVTLAPTFHQVRGILWREINRVHRAGGLPGKMNTTEWWLGEELVGFGRSPKDTDPTSIQGIHARYVLVIFDEACGIARALWDAADSLIANDDSRFLAIGNPDDPGTMFGDVCRPGSGWNVIHLDAFSSPNFTGEQVPDWLRPLLVSKVWVAEKKKSWGEQSPIYTSKVLGRFPEQSTDSLVPVSALTAALERELAEGEENDLGVDVARFGNDHSVIYHRRGMVAKRLRKLAKRDTMEVTGHVVDCVRETGARRVKVDDIGLGGGVTDRLRELLREGKLPPGTEIVAVNVAEAPATDLMDERFKNLRAELNWNMRVRFIDGKIALLGNNDDLCAQAGQIKYKFTSSGEIIIEKKEDMKKRTGGVSPDDWDALVLAFAEPQFAGAGILEFYRRQAEDKTRRETLATAPKVVTVTEAGGGVRFRAPPGTSTLYGMSGRRYDPDAEGCFVVLPDDAPPLRALMGWAEAPSATAKERTLAPPVGS